MTGKFQNPRVIQAALWLATTPDNEKPHPLIPELRQRFALTAVEACAAITETNLIKAKAL